MPRRTTMLLGIVVILIVAVLLIRANTANVQRQAQTQLDNRQLTLEATPAP